MHTLMAAEASAKSLLLIIENTLIAYLLGPSEWRVLFCELLCVKGINPGNAKNKKFTKTFDCMIHRFPL